MFRPPSLCRFVPTRRVTPSFFAALLLGTAVLCGGEPANAERLVVRNVTVVDPATGTATPNLDVAIEDGEVISLSAADGTRAGLSGSSTVEVDGRGRYLLPGLWDLHVHLDMHTPTDLVMLVAHGVLNVRDMGGDPFLATELKRAIASGELVGPNIRAAGAILEDRRWLTRVRATNPDFAHRLPVDNVAEARFLVDLLASWGSDLVKVRNVTDERTFRAIATAAAEHGMQVAGHEPIVFDLATAADLGMSTFEHLPFISLTMPGDEADPSTVEATITSLLENGAAVVPTLIASRSLGDSVETRLARIEREDPRDVYLPDSVRASWRRMAEDDAGPLPWEVMRTASMEILRQMQAAGVPVLAGTDLGVPGTFPGFALHDELRLLAEGLGLTPAAALRTATSAPARFVGAPKRSRVQVGSPADLLLVDGNPLEDLGHLDAIHAVIVRGRLLDRGRLEDLLLRVREAKDEFEGWKVHAGEGACADANPECFERQGGMSFSRGHFDQAHALYGRAIEAGAGSLARKARAASALNLLHAQAFPCEDAPAALQPLFEGASTPDARVEIHDWILPALGARCQAQRRLQLTQLAAIDRDEVSPRNLPIWIQHAASHRAEVEGDGGRAFELRVSLLPEDWRDDPARLQEIAGWCLEVGVELERGRKLAQRSAQIAKSPLDRLQSMLLEARIASADGDHAAAVTLMETIDAAIPNNSTVTQLLEQFRTLAADDSTEFEEP